MLLHPHTGHWVIIFLYKNEADQKHRLHKTNWMCDEIPLLWRNGLILDLYRLSFENR